MPPPTYLLTSHSPPLTHLHTLLTPGGSLDDYPNVVKWWASVKDVPVVKDLFESGTPMIP